MGHFCQNLKKKPSTPCLRRRKTIFYRKWALLKYEKGFDYTLFKKIMGFILILVVAIIFWNAYMAAEISRRKKVEARLAKSERALRQTNEELREMEALKDNLAHMIIHDMRSPLSGISGSLELLEDRLVPADPDGKLGQFLRLAKKRGQHPEPDDAGPFGYLQAGIRRPAFAAGHPGSQPNCGPSDPGHAKPGRDAWPGAGLIGKPGTRAV